MDLRNATVRDSVTRQELDEGLDDILPDMVMDLELAVLMENGPKIVALIQPHEPELAAAMGRLHAAMAEIMAFAKARQAVKG